MPKDHKVTKNAVKLLNEYVDTCAAVNGNPYHLPYFIRPVVTAGEKQIKIPEDSCKDATALDEGSAARVPVIYLVRYIHAKPADKAKAKKELDGAIEYFWKHFFALKASVTRDNGKSFHDQRRKVAPYYLYSGATAVAAALSMLRRDFPREGWAYSSKQAALRNGLHGEWDAKEGLFRTFGTDMAQFDQPLAGLSMFGLGVCAKRDTPTSFAMLEPGYEKGVVYHQSLDTSGVRQPVRQNQAHQNNSAQKSPEPKRNPFRIRLPKLPKIFPWQK